ncbi:hypothetical protein H632_c4531p0, partial [Helicosporidium sp. ATCC 50920]
EVEGPGGLDLAPVAGLGVQSTFSQAGPARDRTLVSSAAAWTLDLCACQQSLDRIALPLHLVLSSPGEVHGLVVWTDCRLDAGVVGRGAEAERRGQLLAEGAMERWLRTGPPEPSSVHAGACLFFPHPLVFPRAGALIRGELCLSFANAATQAAVKVLMPQADGQAADKLLVDRVYDLDEDADEAAVARPWSAA